MRRPLKLALAGFGLLLLAAASLTVAFLLDPLSFTDGVIRWHLAQQHVRSESVQVDGYTIHYFEARPPSGPGIPLVLIHGLGSRGEDWSPLIPSLAAAGFHVYVPDLLGYGRSSRPDVDYSISLEETTIVDFMHALHLERADVGGWSMGGWVALKLTVDHPEMVDHLVAYDSAGIYFPATFQASLFTPTDAAGLAHLVSMLTPQRRPIPWFVERAVVRRLQANASIVHRSVDSMTGGRDLLDFQLQRIHTPTLVVWGEKDMLIPLSVGQAIERQIPGARLVVIPGCGHLAPSECAKPVLRATVAFLHDQPAPRE